MDHGIIAFRWRHQRLFGRMLLQLRSDELVRANLVLRLGIVALGALALLTGATTTVQASIQVGDIVRIGDGPGTPGGIFYVKDLANNKLADTFCVQLEEFVRFDTTYLVAGISTSTVGAGAKPLTSFAAWLYDRYLNGVAGSGPALSNFDFANVYAQTSASAARMQANELQLAIWQAMGYTPAEIGGASNGGWYDTYDGKLAGWEADFNSDVANNLWSGTGDIYVLNLLRKNGAGNYTINAQDQLIRIPSDVIPEPVSLAVWSVLGVAAVGICRLRGAI
jgi:hypothetical protein